MVKAFKLVSGISRLGSNPKKLISQLGRPSVLAAGALQAPGILSDFDLPRMGHGRASANSGLKSSLCLAGDGPGPNLTRAFLQFETCALLAVAVFLSDAYFPWIRKDNRASTTSTCPKHDYAVTEAQSPQAPDSTTTLTHRMVDASSAEIHAKKRYGVVEPSETEPDTTTSTPPKPVAPRPSGTRKHHASRIFEASILSVDASFA